MRLMQRLRRHAPSDPPAPATGSVAALLERLNLVSQVRLGRALLIEQMDTGDCGACALEVEALNDLVRQLERLGLRFVHQPRNADVLLVTGPVTTNLREALERTWLALPEPRWVMAVGDCAVDGGVFKDSPAVHAGAATVVPVDLAVRGCPPTPEAVLSGLLTLLEANASPDPMTQARHDPTLSA